jgi:hypothetical protein
MPALMAKARARITAIFFMAVSPLQRCRDCQNKARTSVIAITFWSFRGLSPRAYPWRGDFNPVSFEIGGAHPPMAGETFDGEN